MSLREMLSDLMKPQKVREAEWWTKHQEARRQEQQAIIDFMKGNIDMTRLNQIREETAPFTRIDLRRMASHLPIDQTPRSLFNCNLLNKLKR